MLQQSVDAQTAAIRGTVVIGKAARDGNINAVSSLAGILRSSFGPLGLDKMLIDKMGEITTTNDGATILKLMELEHPAAKMMGELAKQQDFLAGDGTTTVVLLTAELLRRAKTLFETSSLSQPDVIAGYTKACREILRVIDEKLVVDVASLKNEALLQCAQTALSSKNIGGETKFAQMAVDAVKLIEASFLGKKRCDITKINVLKALGKGNEESILVEGYVLNCRPGSGEMPRCISKAKILCFDMDFQKERMKLGVSIVVESPENLEDIRKRESELTREKIERILATGANVVLTARGIDDMAMKMFAEKNVMAVRRCNRKELLVIAKAAGTELISTMAGLNGEEDVLTLGTAEKVEVECFGDNECIVIRELREGGSAGVVLRGPNEAMLEEMERSLHDAFCTVKRVLESGVVVAGGGAVEADLAVFLRRQELDPKAALINKAFGEALLALPRTLCENASLDITEAMAELMEQHEQEQEFAGLGFEGLSGDSLSLKHKIVNCLEEGILEPAVVKISAIKSATEAAILLLRIDQCVTVEKEKEPEKEHCH